MPRPKLAGSRLQLVVDFYYAIAASRMRLVILVKAGAGGVGVATCYDKLVLSTMNDFFNTLTDDEIATRYVPKVS